MLGLAPKDWKNLALFTHDEAINYDKKIDYYLPIRRKIKHSRDIESQMDISVTPIALGIPNKTLLDHGPGIGHMDLKYMSAGFDVYAKRQGIIDAIRLICELWKVLCVEGHSVGELETASHT